MTDIPRHPEMGPPIDAPLVQPPAPDNVPEFLPGAGLEAEPVNDMTRPPGSAPTVPELAEVDFSGISDGAGPDMPRFSNAGEAASDVGDGAEAPGSDPEPALPSDAGRAADGSEGPELEAGGPPDQPPPTDDLPPISGGDDEGGDGFSDEQLRGLFEASVQDLPPQEYQEVAHRLEAYAVGGERIEDPTHYHMDDGTIVEDTDRGWSRPVSPDALAAEGVPYDQASAVVLEQSGEVPYVVGITAARTVTQTVEMPVGDGSERVSLPVDGEERKSVSFVIPDSGDPVPDLNTYNTLRTVSLRHGVMPEAGIPYTAVNATFDENAPPMTLAEFRGIMRAIERADEFPEDPASIVLRATIGANDVPGGEMIGPEDLPFTDMPQEVRGAFLRQADMYARSGRSSPGIGGAVQHVRPIPEDISRRYGFTGAVMARVDEAPDIGYYRAGITVQEAAEIDIPDGRGGTARVAGAREQYLAVYGQTGRLQGYPNQTSPDEAAGDGLHLQYIGHTTYRVPGSHMLDYRVEPDISYGQARRMLVALQDALERSKAEGQ